MPSIVAFAVGLVFGIGLLVSRMVDPAKILGFLDLAGRFDPSLALVMAGAIPISAFGFALAARRGATLRGAPVHLPGTRGLDRRLVVGSLVFGIGWGIGGFCPGPALTAVGLGEPKALAFVAAMLAGMAVFEWRERRRPPALEPAT